MYTKRNKNYDIDDKILKSIKVKAKNETQAKAKAKSEIEKEIYDLLTQIYEIIGYPDEEEFDAWVLPISHNENNNTTNHNEMCYNANECQTIE